MVDRAVVQTLPRQASGPTSPGWWGMALFITTEAALFALLVFSYFYLRSGSATWPPAGIDRPELVLPAIATVILIGSSIPVAWADAQMRRGNAWVVRIGFAIAFAMGIVFLAIQVYEYTREQFTPQSIAYGSLFFTITGIHGLHVIVGLLMNAFIQVRAWLGHFTANRRLAVQNAAMYWHFVDAVWIVIFASLYISPYLS